MSDKKEKKEKKHTPLFEHAITKIIAKATVMSKDIATQVKEHFILKDVINLHLLRYTLTPNPDKTLYFALDSDKKFNACNVIGAPIIENTHYFPAPIREGWIYVYDEYEEKWHEFKANKFGGLVEIEWETYDDDSYNERNKEIGSYVTSLKLSIAEDNGKCPIYWLAYSEVQWSVKYLKAVVLDNNKREKRMQKFDCSQWIKNQYQDGVSTFLSINAYFKKDDFGLSYSFDNYKRDYDTIRVVQDDAYLCLHDPLGATNDIVEELKREYAYLEALCIAPTSLCCPESILKEQYPNHYKLSNDIPNLSKEEKEQYEAVFQSATIIYQNIFSTENKEYQDLVDKERLKSLLSVKDRKRQREKIDRFRDKLGNFIKSNYYQNILYDYSENTDQNRILGEMRINGDHYSPLADLPRFHDQHLDLYYKTEPDKWREFLKDTFFGKDVDLSATNWEYRKNHEEYNNVFQRLLLKPYENSNYSSNIEWADKIVQNLNVIFTSLGPFATNIVNQKRLLEKLNLLEIDKTKLFELENQQIRQIKQQVQTELDELKKQIQHKAEKAGRATHSKDIRTKRLLKQLEYNEKRFDTINKKKTQDWQKIKKDTLQKVAPTNKAIKELEIQVFKYDKFKKLVDKISGSHSLHVSLCSLSIMNLSYAIVKLDQQSNTGSVTNTVIASIELSSLVLSTSAFSQVDAWLTKLLIKNGIVRFSAALGWAGNIVMAFEYGMSSSRQFNAKNTRGGTLYALASATAVISVGGFVVSAIAAKVTIGSALLGLVAGPVAWVAVGLSILFSYFAAKNSYNDFQSVLSAGIFGEDIKGIHPNSAPSVMMKTLCSDESRKQCNTLTLTNGTELDLSDYKAMYSWLFEYLLGKTDYSEFTFHQKECTTLTGKAMLYDKYRHIGFLNSPVITTTFRPVKPSEASLEAYMYLKLVGISLPTKDGRKIENPMIMLFGKTEGIVFDEEKNLYKSVIKYPSVVEYLNAFVPNWKNDITEESFYLYSNQVILDEDNDIYMPLYKDYYNYEIPFKFECTNNSKKTLDEVSTPQPKLATKNKTIESILEKEQGLFLLSAYKLEEA